MEDVKRCIVLVLVVVLGSLLNGVSRVREERRGEVGVEVEQSRAEQSGEVEVEEGVEVE